MKSTTATVNYKNFDLELEIIDSLEQLSDSDIEIKKEGLFSTKATVSKNGKEIIIKANNGDLRSYIDHERIDGVEARLMDKDFVLDALYIDSNHLALNDSGVSQETSASCSIVKTHGFNKTDQSIYRCFIKTDPSKLPTFFKQIETVTYQDDKIDHFYDCIRIELENYLFDIIRLKPSDTSFIVIECAQDIEFNKFRDFCFAIKQALGFCSGYMPGGEEYFFDKDSNWYYVNHLRSGIDSLYRPINWNPHSILHNKPEIAEKFEGKLNFVSSIVFSNLVSKIHASQELSSSIIVLLEASSVRSLLLIPSVFSVIIESLSKIISIDESGKEYPIEDVDLAKKIKAELTKLVETYSDQISPQGLLKIPRRLNDYNKPVVKEHLTNNEKLTLPFEQLGIVLTMDDINTIEHRNDLLHGNILLTDDEPKSEDEINNYMGYVSAKLYTLISALILKNSGYCGYIINHSKFYEDRCNIETQEDYYRLI